MQSAVQIKGDKK